MLNFSSSLIQAPDNWAKRNRGARKSLVIAATVITVLYVLIFLYGELLQELRRADVFVWLMLPDWLLSGLMGGASAGESVVLGFGDRFLPIVVGAIWLAAATCIGRAVTIPLVALVGQLELIGLSCLAGLSLLSTGVLLLGLAGWLTRISVSLIALVGCAVAYWLIQRSKRVDEPAKSSPPGYDEQFKLTSQIATWLWRLVPVVVSILAAAYLLNGLLPAFEFDVVEYHMQGPKEFYQAGRISFSPHNVYLNMPLATEMHSLAMMVLIGGPDGWWLGGMAGKLVIAAYSLLSALLAGGFVVRYFGKTAGWSAAAILLSAPGNIHVAGCGLIDSALGAFALASAVGLQLFRESVRNRSAALSHIAAITCLFAFSAAACKYTGLVFVTLPVLLALVVFARGFVGQLLNVRVMMICTLTALVTVAPWYLKNLVATGNPVYPLASSVFGAGNLQEDQIQRWQAAHRLPKASDGSAFGWQSMSGSIERILLKSEYLPMAIVPLSLIGVLVLPWADRTVGAKRKDWLRHPAFLFAIGGAWILFAWFAFTHRIDRFWLPALPLAAVVASVSVHWLVANGIQSLVAAVVLLGSVFGLLISLSGIYSDNRWFVSYETLRHDVASEESVGRLPVTIDWVNTNLPKDAKLLLIGQAQAYRFEREIAYATCFNTPPGERELRMVDVAKQRSWLSENGYTHVLVQWSEIDRYRSPGNYGFSSWPTSSEMQAMVEGGLLRRVDWPIDARAAELFEVVSLGKSKPEESTEK
ncbi:MAG: hypothetical protein U0930_01830 [Pirellulales bacterium]